MSGVSLPQRRGHLQAHPLPQPIPMLFDPRIITRSVSFKLEAADGTHLLILLMYEDYGYLINWKRTTSFIQNTKMLWMMLLVRMIHYSKPSQRINVYDVHLKVQGVRVTGIYWQNREKID